MQKNKKIFLAGVLVALLSILFCVQEAHAADTIDSALKKSVYDQLQNSSRDKTALEKEMVDNQKYAADLALALQIKDLQAEYETKLDSLQTISSALWSEIQENGGADTEYAKLTAEYDAKIDALKAKMNDKTNANLTIYSKDVLQSKLTQANQTTTAQKESLKNYQSDLANTKEAAKKLGVVCPDGVPCQELSEPIGDTYIVMSEEGGTSFLMQYASLLYKWIAGIIGFIAVLMIVISGFQITVSGVIDTQAEAKERIYKAFAGLALLFLTSLILYTVNPTFFN